MGTSSTANLAWGFEIPADKLLALLECFKKHAKDTSNSKQAAEDDSVEGGDQDSDITGSGGASVLGARRAEEKEGSAKKQKVEDVFTKKNANELNKFLESDEMTQYWDTFETIIQGTGEDDDDDGPIRVAFVYCDEDIPRLECDRWGAENYGTNISTLGQLSPEKMKKEGWEKRLKEFEVAMHFEEAGIELPLKEEWILSVFIG